MTQYNYDRRYSLSITRPTRSFNQGNLETLNQITTGTLLDRTPTTPFSFAYTPTDDLISVTNTTTVIQDLQIVVDVESSNQTQGSDGRKAKIKIYNLSESTRAIIARKDNLVVLKAGYVSYEDELPIVFSGQVISHSTKKEGQDMITTLECGDGYTPYTTARTSLRVSAGNTYRDVFLALAGEMNKAGVVTGKIVTEGTLGTQAFDIAPSSQEAYKRLDPKSVLLVKGWAYSGKVSKALDDLCETFNHTWQIINNRLYIYPKYYPDMVGTVTLNTDQILSLEDVEDGTETGSNPAEGIGIKVTTLLDGRIEDAKSLIITSGRKSGQYPIRSVQHKLDYEGNAWHTIVECGGG